MTFVGQLDETPPARSGRAEGPPIWKFRISDGVDLTGISRLTKIDGDGDWRGPI